MYCCAIDATHGRGGEKKKKRTPCHHVDWIEISNVSAQERGFVLENRTIAAEVNRFSLTVAHVDGLRSMDTAQLSRSQTEHHA